MNGLTRLQELALGKDRKVEKPKREKMELEPNPERELPKPFDRKAYQREYMRLYRAAKKLKEAK